jgi:hypothetical protein
VSLREGFFISMAGMQLVKVIIPLRDIKLMSDDRLESSYSLCHDTTQPSKCSNIPTVPHEDVVLQKSAVDLAREGMLRREKQVGLHSRNTLSQ